MSVIPKFYTNSVVAIGHGTVADSSWIGTGFLIYREIQNSKNKIPMLVTNRHVVKDEKSIVVRFRKKDSDEFIITEASLVNEKGESIYITHPTPKIDIAIVPLNGKYIIENNLAFDGFDIDKNHSLSSEQLRNEGLDEGSLVYMLGFPLGLVNINSVDPICRLGCVARISKDQIEETYNILVDIQNFPGNSGSPIVTRPEHMALPDTKAFPKCVLLGIVHSYIPYQESLMNTQTKRIVEIRSENSGLAYVHPVEYIREVVDLLVQKYNYDNDSAEDNATETEEN